MNRTNKDATDSICKYCGKTTPTPVCENCKNVILNFSWCLDCDCSQDSMLLCRECSEKKYRTILEKWKADINSSIAISET